MEKEPAFPSGSPVLSRCGLRTCDMAIARVSVALTALELPRPSCSKSKLPSISVWTVAKLQVLKEWRIPFACTAKAVLFSLYVYSLRSKQNDHIAFPTSPVYDGITVYPDTSLGEVQPSNECPSLTPRHFASVDGPANTVFFLAFPACPSASVSHPVPVLQLQSLPAQPQSLLTDSSFSLYTAPPAVPPSDACLFNLPLVSSAPHMWILQGLAVLPASSLSCCNLLSTLSEPDDVSSFSAKDVSEGFMIGPFTSPALLTYHVTHKYSGKKRHIIDLSASHGSSEPFINCLMPSSDFSLHYATLDNAILLIKQTSHGA
ncbi:hypothetical protein MHYP_G00347160 [Metynnis hypsauchen]